LTEAQNHLSQPARDHPWFLKSLELKERLAKVLTVRHIPSLAQQHASSMLNQLQQLLGESDNINLVGRDVSQFVPRILAVNNVLRLLPGGWSNLST
jgi:hypothetical protein